MDRTIVTSYGTTPLLGWIEIETIIKNYINIIE